MGIREVSTYLAKRNSELQDEVAELRALLRRQQATIGALSSLFGTDPDIWDSYRDAAEYFNRLSSQTSSKNPPHPEH